MAELRHLTLVMVSTLLCVTGVRSQSQQSPTAAENAGSSNWIANLNGLFAAGRDGQGQMLSSLDTILREQQQQQPLSGSQQRLLQEMEGGPQAGTGMFGPSAANADLVSLFGMGIGQGLQDLVGVPSPAHGPTMAAALEPGPQLTRELTPALDHGVTTPTVVDELLGKGADVPLLPTLPPLPPPGAESEPSPTAQVPGPLTVHASGKKRLAAYPPGSMTGRLGGDRGQLLRGMGLLPNGQRSTDVSQQALRLLGGSSVKSGLGDFLGLVPTIHGAPLANTIKNTLRLSALKGVSSKAPFVLAH